MGENVTYTFEVLHKAAASILALADVLKENPNHDDEGRFAPSEGHANASSADRRKRWRARNPHKDLAHRTVATYVAKLRKAGLPMPSCDGCGRSEDEVKAAGFKHGIHAHHTDYSRPLDVKWLCPTCHIKDHWTQSWHAERDGKKVKMTMHVTVIEGEAK